MAIVIPTHNRYEKVKALLRSVRERHDDRIRAIIVVDDSDEIEEPEEFGDIGVQHIKLGTRHFISKAKNIGWRATQSDYVFFVDDDNVVGETTLGPLLDTISNSDSVGAVMPAVLYESQPNLVWVYSTPFLNKRMEMNLVGRNQPRNPSLEGRILRTDALPNASLIRRTALQDVGGFDERLVVNSSLDLCQRLKGKGWHVLANTAALIYHDVEVPGRLGWWAAHGLVDPPRVRYELRDWFLIRKGVHGGGPIATLRSVLDSLRFVMPNTLAYILRGRSKALLLRSVLIGYAEGIRLSF